MYIYIYIYTYNNTYCEYILLIASNHSLTPPPATRPAPRTLDIVGCLIYYIMLYYTISYYIMLYHILLH